MDEVESLSSIALVESLKSNMNGLVVGAVTPTVDTSVNLPPKP
jgi:hypothetical protein